MRYFFAIVLPPIAVFGCGKVLSGFLNAILSVVSGIFLLSGMALSPAPLLEASGALLLPLAGILWLATCTHALWIVSRHSAETRSEGEHRQLSQQIELMRRAGTKNRSAQQLGERVNAVPQSAPTP